LRDVRCGPVDDNGQQRASRQVDGVVLFGGEGRVCDKRRPEPSQKQNGGSNVARHGAIEDFRGDQHRVDRQADVQRREAIQRAVVPNQETEHRVDALAVRAWSTDRQEKETEKTDGGQGDESGRVFPELFPFCCHPGDEEQK